MKQDFLDAGFTVIDGGCANHPLLDYLKEHYPMVIRDNELDLMQLKTLLGLPIDDKVNGYGLNFIGRNFARAKYQQETDKELVLNTAMSKDIDTTKNLVLKGDNLDSLKILKHYYKGKIKCIYIDPQYNTNGDEFIYPDKFDKEETEVLGLANLSEDDFARLDFSFKTKKSHNGWLSFMYPRLLLAQELLSDDGVIFISIDDNEQANLKLLCDDVFGEENFLSSISLKMKNVAGASGGGEDKKLKKNIEYLLIYVKNYEKFSSFKPAYKLFEIGNLVQLYKLENKSWKYTSVIVDYGTKEYITSTLDGSGDEIRIFLRNNYEILSVSELAKRDNIDESEVYIKYAKRIFQTAMPQSSIRPRVIEALKGMEFDTDLFSIEYIPKTGRNKGKVYEQFYKGDKFRLFSWLHDVSEEINGKLYKKEMEGTFWDLTSNMNNLSKEGSVPFDNGKKPIFLIKRQLEMMDDKNAIILDFFAGSGATGHAVIQLNAEDGGHRKFILCQIDEPIDPIKKKDEYKFCLDNNLPPVISSITIERLNRAGESIKADIEQHNAKKDVVESDKKQLPDIGYKVFDTTPAPILTLDEENFQIAFPKEHTNAISRIYHMIFKVGVDEPTQVPIAIIDECMYKLGSNYYITDSHKVSEDVLLDALKDGRVYIDGWTASLDVSLQSQKDKVQIVF